MATRKPDEHSGTRLWAAAVAVLAVVVYLNAFGNGFVLDDVRLIRDNVRIRSLANVPQFFASSYWGAEGAQALYRPLVLATYAVNYALDGLSTGGYMAVNVALHAGVSLLLFALIRALGGSAFAAGVAGALFAVHPVHTEAVAGISGRPESMAAFFGLLAVYLDRRAARARDAALALRAACLASFACALLSKESAITLVVVVLAMDRIVPVRRDDGQLVTFSVRARRSYLPFLAVGIAYLAIRRAVLGGVVIGGSAIAPLDNPLVPLAATPLGDRMGATAAQAIMTPFAVLAEYARLIVWPARLSPDYSYNQIPLVTSALDVRFMAGVLIVVACIAALATLWRKAPLAAFGIAFLAITYSIVSNFVLLIGTICAERLLYLPSAGACVAAGVAAERLARTAPSRRRAVAGVLVVLLAAAGGRTWIRNRDWRDEASLWTSAIAVAPASARVQSEYGRVLMTEAEQTAAAGRTADAERLYADARSHFEAAVRIYPSYSLPLDGLAMIASLSDRFDEADALYARALQAWPDNYGGLTNWASLGWDHARRLGASAVDLQKDGKAADAQALARQADAALDQARARIDRAVALAPTYAQAHLVRAMILELYPAERAAAIADYETVLQLEPSHAQRPQIEAEVQRLRNLR
jgi:tetratricopeptide (TPR) repeat protein